MGNVSLRNKKMNAKFEKDCKVKIRSVKELVERVERINEDISILCKDPNSQEVMKFCVALALPRPLPKPPIKKLLSGRRKSNKKPPEPKCNLERSMELFPDHFIHPYTASCKTLRTTNFQILDDHFVGHAPDKASKVLGLQSKDESSVSQSDELQEHQRDELPSEVSEASEPATQIQKSKQSQAPVERPRLPEEPFHIYQQRKLKEADLDHDNKEGYREIDVLTHGLPVVLITFESDPLAVEDPDFVGNGREIPVDNFLNLSVEMEGIVENPLGDLDQENPQKKNQCDDDFEIIETSGMSKTEKENECARLKGVWNYARGRCLFTSRYIGESAIVLNKANVSHYQNKMLDALEAIKAPRIPGPDTPTAAAEKVESTQESEEKKPAKSEQEEK